MEDVGWVIVHPFIALTDKAWFDFLAAHTTNGAVDEVNFWSPRSTKRMRAMKPGDPVFFRLKTPWRAIAGYGVFAHFTVLDLEIAWECFGWKNGDRDRGHFLERIGRYRGVDLFKTTTLRAPLGCTILRSATFWPKERWIPWSTAEGWHANIVQGKTETSPERAKRLLMEMAAVDQVIPDELTSADFVPQSVDERTVELREVTMREGQGAFRARVLDAYGRRCAITGEHTEPVLDAAHIQPYLGPRSNHLQNGLLLTKEFHALFDLGYVTITPDYRARVSPALRKEWRNGHRYYPFDGKQLVSLPNAPSDRPSVRALKWHGDHVFRRAS